MNNKVARVLAGVLTGLALLGGSVANAAGVAAEPSENVVLVNGQEVHFDSYLIDGRNYVQLRELGDATGFTVDWDEKTNSVLITTAISGREEAVAVIDGQTLRVGAILVDGKRYIALEDLAKLDGADFNATTGRLNFTAPGQIEMAARLVRQRNLLWVLGALLAVAVLVLIPLLRRRAQGVTELAETRVTTEVPKSPLLRLHHETEHEEVRQEETEEKQSVVQERATRQIVDEICGSVLPQRIRYNAATSTFEISGAVQAGKRQSCSFYDHFFLDEKYLCVVMGQVPGSGIANALFMVVAQTAIRSRLRMGRSLIETMSDVNAQLFDLGGENELCALVGVLNTVDGTLNFVNAGGAVPFLMRSEGRFEWLKTPVYSALGANENVNYRSERLRLNQGDRLFLYTADLGDMTDDEGTPFREKELQAALNRSRSQARNAEELLRFVADDAAAYCENGDSVCNYAAVALEYQKGSREYIFTVVPGKSEFAPAVTDFMRKTLRDGGIDEKVGARQVLLVDELFALCCRSCTEGTDIKVECGIRSEEKTVNIRMFAAMGGSNPLEAGEDAAGGNAADYIRSHTKNYAFQSGLDRDMVEITSTIS